MTELQRPPFRLGGWLVTPGSCALRHENGTDQRQLEPRVMRVLLCLVDAAPEVVPHDTLLAEVWGATHVSSGSISLAISELRRALGDNARKPSYVKTVSRVGYRLLVDPQPVNLPDVEASGARAGQRVDPPRLEELRSVPDGAADLSERVQAVVGCGRSTVVVSARTSRVLRAGAFLAALAGLSTVLWLQQVTGGLESNVRTSAPFGIDELAGEADLRPVTSLAGFEMEPSRDPAGRLALARWAGSGTLMRVHLEQDDGSFQALSPGPGFEKSPVWAPDGGAIAFLRCVEGDCGLWLDRLDGRPASLLAPLRSAGGRRLSWAPGGESLVVSDMGPEGRLALFEVAVDRSSDRSIGPDGLERSLGARPMPRLRVAPSPRQDDGYPVFSNRGGRLAFVRGSRVERVDRRFEAIDGEIWVQLPSGHLERVPSGNLDVRGMAWSPDDRSLVVASFSPDRGTDLLRLDVGTGRQTVLHNSPMILRNPWVGSDGHVLFESWRGDRNLWRMDFQGASSQIEGRVARNSEPEVLVNSTWSDEGPALDPLGRRLAFQSSRSGTYQLWIRDLPSGREWQLSRVGLDELPTAPLWSPDGRTLAFFVEAPTGSELLLASMEEGTVVRRLRVPDRAYVSSYPANDRLLYTALEAGQWNVWSLDLGSGDRPELLQPNAIAGVELSVSGGSRSLLFAMPQRTGIYRRELGPGATEGVELWLETQWPPTRRSWGVVADGVYFCERRGDRYEIELLAANGQRRRILGSVPVELAQSADVAVAQDASWAAFVRLEGVVGDIYRVDPPQGARIAQGHLRKF